jgi:hypothetical protein
MTGRKFTRFDDQVDGVVVSQDRHFNAARKIIADLTLARSLLLAIYSRETVDADTLLSHGPRFTLVH